MLPNSAMGIFKKTLPNWIQVYFIYSYFQKEGRYQWLPGVGAGRKESAMMGTKMFQDK